MTDQNDEKYAKAAKQSRRDLLGFIVIVVIIIAADFVYLNSAPSSASPVLKKSPLSISAFDAEPSTESLEILEALVQRHDATVRSIKEQVDFFEKDSSAQAAAKALQDTTRKLLHKRYGMQEPYRVAVDLEFQDTMPDFAENGKQGSFVIELAPSSLQPHSIYTFLEVSRQWKEGGAFHRIAPHVLQVMVKTHSKIQHLAFQEYSPEYPHKERTVGYAGRPSGPAWYVSIIDNSRNHGPGSQQKRNPYEADSCFGTVIDGWDSVIRITKVQGEGFLSDANKHVLIKTMTIQTPSAGGDGSYVAWHDAEGT
mmetsp:Transcript_13069/g.21630  ORF Transcript_13069/g.21630 Transcript_13069/m.21630 type:complete len:310 (+) Transcript_13069:228-1157(+)